MYTEATIEIIICDSENIVKYIPLIRKLTKESIQVIRENALNNKPIISCQHTKYPEEFKEMYQTVKGLIAKGAVVKILDIIPSDFDEFVREINLEIIENYIQTSDEIEKETLRLIDLELGEE